MSVLRLGYVHIKVTDLTEARDHYVNTLGMDAVLEADGIVYLKSWDEADHHSVVLHEGGVGLVKLGYKVSDDCALADLEKRAQAFGATVERMSKADNASVDDGIRVGLPSDHRLELAPSFICVIRHEPRSTVSRADLDAGPTDNGLITCGKYASATASCTAAQSSKC
jgi:hypothetical protein